MKICAYTSCSINYLPKARVLADTLKRHHPDAVLVICLNDVFPSWLQLSNEPFDYIWQPKDLGFSESWVFMHNVMEICTAVKGRALVKMLSEFTADLYLYLDPDVVVYGDLSPALQYMGDDEIGLIPHITKPESTEIGVQLTELSVVAHGTYNLGHLLIRSGDSASAFAEWWDARLTKFCYDDKEYGLFTDQRWCDLVPALFDKVRILRQPNLDVASWNIYGRSITYAGPGVQSPYVIDGFPLLTYHFSGTGPAGTHRRIREVFAPGSSAVAEIERNYEIEIASREQDLLEKFPYGGDFFDNGELVNPRARHLYRKNIKLQSAFSNPYKTSGDSYYKWLSREQIDMVSVVSLHPHQIESAFEEIFDEKFYLESYPEAASMIESGDYLSALDHYIRIGSVQLKDPNALFVSSYYYEQAHKLNGLSIRSFSSPKKENTLLWHYLAVGISCGIEPVEYFNSSEYLLLNSDVAFEYKLLNISCPLSHFIQYGDREGRRPSKAVDLSQFVEASDQARKLMTETNIGPFSAFARLGRVQGRAPI